MSAGPPDPLTPHEARRLLGVCLRTVYRWALTGVLRSWRKGPRLIVLSRSDVMAAVREQAPQPKPEPPALTPSRRAAAARKRHTQRILKMHGVG